MVNTSFQPHQSLLANSVAAAYSSHAFFDGHSSDV